MELAIDRGEDGPTFTRDTKQLKNAEGRPIGVANDNPILYTRMYEVEYFNGYNTSLSIDTISENLFLQVYSEGNWHVLFDVITYHSTDGKEVKQQENFTKK